METKTGRIVHSVTTIAGLEELSEADTEVILDRVRDALAGDNSLFTTLRLIQAGWSYNPSVSHGSVLREYEEVGSVTAVQKAWKRSAILFAHIETLPAPVRDAWFKYLEDQDALL